MGLGLLRGQIAVAEVLRQRLLEEGGAATVLKGVTAVEQFVEDDSQGEDVGVGGELLVLEDLGGTVGDTEAGVVV